MMELHNQPNSDGSLFSSDPGIISQSLNNSCDHCRNRKIKCNSEKPSCAYCSRRKLPCTYSINKKKQIFSGAPLKISLNELEDRIQRLEILSSNILLQQQCQDSQTDHHSPAISFSEQDQVRWSQPSLFSSDTFGSISKSLLPTVLPKVPGPPPIGFSAETSTVNYSNGLTCLPLSMSEAQNQVGGYQNFNSSFSLSQDLLGVDDLRRILLASYRSKGESKGFANHHKSILIELCLSSNLVMASFCAMSCAHASFPFLDHSPVTRRRLIDHFLSHAKSLLVKEGYSNPSLAVIQAILLIGIVEYEKGRFERCISYYQSVFCMACVLDLPQLDASRIGVVTSDGAAERKMWWEIFTMERCLPFMLYEQRGVIPDHFQVMLADNQGCSLGFLLDDLEVFHACCFMKDPDPVQRLLPVVRLKMLDLLWRAHSLAVRTSKASSLTDADHQKVLRLQQDLSSWASFASPNPFLGSNSSTSMENSAGGALNLPYNHPITQASFVILFNCAYILAYSPTLYRHNHPETPFPFEDDIPDSCGVAAGHLLDGISLSKPENPRGERWHQLLPFFAYIGCLVYYRLYANRPHNPAAQKTAFDRFQALYLELALSLPLFPVADIFMAKLRPLRDSMDDQSP